MSLLTGTATPSTVRPLRLAQEAPKPDRTGDLIDVMKGTLEYLKTPAEERAKREAAELVEQERAKHAESAIAERGRFDAELAQARAAANARETDVANLRKLLTEVGESSERVREESVQLRAAYEQELAVRTEAQRLAEEHRQAFEALRAVPPKVIREPAPAPTLAPEDISFGIVKGASGLLNRVVLKAKGYDDVAIDIHRGADNRIRDLKTGR